MTKNNTPRKRTLRLGKIILLVVIVFCAARMGSKLNHYYELEQKADIYRAQLAVVEEEYAEKQAMIELLDSDAFIERMARENLGMVRQGEAVVSLVNVDESMQMAYSESGEDESSSQL